MLDIKKSFIKSDNHYLNYLCNKTLSEYEINRSSTVHITMHEGFYPIAYSFDFSKCYWHIVAVVMKNNFPAIYDEINEKYLERYKQEFPTAIPSAENKLKINSFIGCLNSKKREFNPFPNRTYGILIMRLAFTALELVIKELERNYDCKVIGANTDGLYFICDDIEAIQNNFKHDFQYKLETLTNLYSTSNNWFWETEQGEIEARGVVRGLFAMSNNEPFWWVIIEDENKKFIKLFTQRDIEMREFDPENNYLKHGKFVGYFYDENLFTELVKAFNALSNEDKVFFAEELREALRNVFYIKSKKEYKVQENIVNQVARAVHSISKKVIVNEQDEIIFSQINKPSSQIIKRSFFVDEIFKQYITLDKIPQKGIIIQAPCGSGKTHATINYLSKNSFGSCIVEPTCSLSYNLQQKYGVKYLKDANIKHKLDNIYTFSYSNGIIDYFVDNKKVIFADEIHTSLWYEPYFNCINKCLSNGIGLSATPPLFYNYLRRTYTFFSLRQKQLPVKIHMTHFENKTLISRRITEHILSNHKAGIKSFFYLDDTNELNKIKNELNKNGITDIIIYATNPNDKDDNFGYSSTKDFIRAANEGTHSVILSTLKGITGVDFNIANLNTIIYCKDILSTIQACARDRINPNIDIYINRHLYYNDGKKLYTYYIRNIDNANNNCETNKALNDELNSSYKMLDILESQLRYNGFNNIRLHYIPKTQREPNKGIPLEVFKNNFISFYETKDCEILNDIAEKKYIQKFNRHGKNIPIPEDATYNDLFSAYLPYFDTHLIQFQQDGYVYKQENIFDQLACKELNWKTSKLKMVHKSLEKGERWNKPYEPEFLDYVKSINKYDHWRRLSKDKKLDYYNEHFSTFQYEYLTPF